jgi:predicted ATPase
VVLRGLGRVVIAERGWESSALGVFVGRARALAELDAALEAAASGQGSLVLVTGDPGIGKTRLAHELTVRARSRGALVLWGTCWEGGGAPAYWPWVQVIRSWIREAGVSLDELGARGGLA